MIQNKCDVIIPVYNAPEWVKLCVYAVFKNTPDDVLNKVIIMNDNSNEETQNLLKNLEDKYGNKLLVVTNEQNLGFVKNCNRGFDFVESEYTLLLNSDCLLSKNTIGKLMDHMKKNEKIGLICPIASNAANLTLPIFTGFNYQQMNTVLESKFLGKNFDACTVVGECLMIRSECLTTVGKLDEIYGMGYGEETDYQFKCMEKGYEAKVAADTYVFHKSEVSFGVSKEKQEKLERNRKIFFDRWQTQYNELLKKYEKNDPIQYINNNLTEKDKQINLNTLVYLPDIIQNAGGCHVVVDLVNYLAINGLNANIVYENLSDYKEIMIFEPIHISNLTNVKCEKVMATIWNSVYKARAIADEKNIPLVYFVQGYEAYFQNASIYGMVQLSFKLADEILTISKYLQRKIKTIFNRESTVIDNGVNMDLYFNHREVNEPKTITLFMRNNVMKGDFLLMDLLKMLNDTYTNITINCIRVKKELFLPILENKGNEIHHIVGPLSRNDMRKIMNTTDIYVDASLNEGFGLLALESIYAGAVPVVSDSFGVDEYLKDGVNGLVVNRVNDVDCYLEEINRLMSDVDLYHSIQKNNQILVKEFDYDLNAQKMVEYFSQEFKRHEYSLSEEEKDVFDNANRVYVKGPEKTKKLEFAIKVWKKMPNGMKRCFLKIKQYIEILNGLETLRNE